MNHEAHLAPLRRAALALHALSDTDRAWMLESLVPADRESLGPLLAELQQLGIPSDACILSEGSQCAGPRRGREQQGRWPEVLDEAGVAVLGRVLAKEPLAVTRTLLGMRAWEWAPALLAQLDHDRREQVQAPGDGVPGRRLQDAILAAVGNEVKSTVLHRMPRTNGWRAMLGLLRRRA